MTTAADEGGSAAELFAQWAQQNQLADVVRTAYESDPQRARSTARLVYTCKGRGCLLLIAWQSPHGLLFYRRRYKLQRAANLSVSTESARRNNTEDGDNHWKAIAGRLDDLRGWEGAGLDLNCDHRKGVVLATALLAEADRATPGHPTRRYL